MSLIVLFTAKGGSVARLAQLAPPSPRPEVLGRGKLGGMK